MYLLQEFSWTTVDLIHKPGKNLMGSWELFLSAMQKLSLAV